MFYELKCLTELNYFNLGIDPCILSILGAIFLLESAIFNHR